jgi:hypothetical protein
VWFQGQDRAIIDALLPAAARAGSSAPADDLGAESSAHGAHSKFAPRRSMAARSTPGSARTGFVAHDHQPPARSNRTEAMDHDKFLIALLLVASPALAEPVTGTIPLPRERPYVSGLGANPQYELGREKYIPNTQPRVPDVVFDSRDQEYMRDQPIDPQLLEFVQKLGRPAPVQLHQQRYLEPNGHEDNPDIPNDALPAKPRRFDVPGPEFNESSAPPPGLLSNMVVRAIPPAVDTSDLAWMRSLFGGLPSQLAPWQAQAKAALNPQTRGLNPVETWRFPDKPTHYGYVIETMTTVHAPWRPTGTIAHRTMAACMKALEALPPLSEARRCARVGLAGPVGEGCVDVRNETDGVSYGIWCPGDPEPQE